MTRPTRDDQPESSWFHWKCPVCGHRIGLHSGPGATLPGRRMGTCSGGPTDVNGGGGPDCAAGPEPGGGTYCGWYEGPLDDYDGPPVFQTLDLWSTPERV